MLAADEQPHDVRCVSFVPGRSGRSRAPSCALSERVQKTQRLRLWARTVEVQAPTVQQEAVGAAPPSVEANQALRLECDRTGVIPGRQIVK